MPIISAAWAEALDPIIRSWFEQGISRRPSMIPALFNVQGSMNSDEQIGSIGAIGVDAWDDYKNSGKVAKVDFNKGYIKTYTHEEYVVELDIQRKFLEDNKYAQITGAADRLGSSAALKREYDAASVFNRAFNSSYTGADAVSLCSTSHPFSPSATGTVQSNKDTLPLTKDNVKTVRERMMAFTDDRNQKIAVTPNMLIVPPQLEDSALVIANSLLDPSSANNAINPQNGRFQVATWHYLTDSNNWFMADSTMMKQSLDWFNRVPLQINPKVQDNTLFATWIAYQRYSFGWSDWRFVYGNEVA